MKVLIMIRPLLLSAAIALTLSGCARIAESRFNPVNWFGRSTVEASAPTEIRPLVPEGRRAQVVEGRELVQSVTAMRIDRTPGGAIVHATGLAATQGYFNAQLVLAGIENGVMTLDFRAEVPAGFQAIWLGTQLGTHSADKNKRKKAMYIRKHRDKWQSSVENLGQLISRTDKYKSKHTKNPL
ncbi:MAG: hypothetical protein COB65_11530, partial [Thalassobium sp.]